jgi:hypothetical protein
MSGGECRLLARFDGSSRCNLAAAIGGKPGMQWLFGATIATLVTQSGRTS